MSHARFMTVSRTFKEMLETPKVDCMIMTRETFKSLEKYINLIDQDPSIGNIDFRLSGLKVFFHRWLGDLIVYGDSENKVIKKIIDSCENRKDDQFHQGIKIKEVIR